MTSERETVNFYWVIPIGQAPHIWGISPSERLERQCSKMGMSWADGETPPDSQVMFLRSDVVYDASILKGLSETPNISMSTDEPLAVCARFDNAQNAKEWLQGEDSLDQEYKNKMPDQIGDSYNHVLRKREAPICEKFTSANKNAIEWRLFMGAYKGVTDVVTKYVWPVPAFHITKLCAKLKITPNMVTIIGALLMVYALWAFYQGHYGSGLLAGWIMTFLDTVDGKLARVTITSSHWGHLFDHGLDLFHPPFWYMAWAYGLSKYGMPLPDGWLLSSIIAMWTFYVLGRLAEGYFIMRFKMHIHVWRRFDSFFRLILARRNPNMIMLTLFWIIGRPDIGLLVIVAWHVLTFIVHCVQSLQAELYIRKSQPIQSWLEQPT